MRLQRRRGREASGGALLEGPHLVAAAIDAGLHFRSLFVLDGDTAGQALARDGGVVALVVDARTLAKLSTTATPQSPVAVVAVPGGAVAPGGRVVVPWGLSDPGNLGTLVRIAAAFGYGLLVGPGCADLWSPKVLRSAAGAHFMTALGSVASLLEVRSGGRTLVATVARGGVAPGALPEAAAVLIGSESHGLGPELIAEADIRVTVPMRTGVESLNAAVAAAIVLYSGRGIPGTNLPAS